MTVGTPIKDAAIRAELETLIAEHAHRLDHHLSQNLGELYTDDGRLIGPNMNYQGREAINAYGRSRVEMKTRRARHVCTNYRFAEDGPEQIKGTFCIMLFRSFGAELAPAEPIAVADAHDIYRRTTDGAWRIHERRVVLCFESEAHRTK